MAESSAYFISNENKVGGDYVTTYVYHEENDSCNKAIKLLFKKDENGVFLTETIKDFFGMCMQLESSLINFQFSSSNFLLSEFHIV